MNLILYKKFLTDWISQTSQSFQTGWRKKAITGFFLVLTIFVIVQLLYSNRELLKSYEWQLNLTTLPIIAVLFTIDLLVATYSWHLQVLTLTNFNNFRHTAKINWYANLSRRIPSPVWYIASRALMYEQVGISKRMTSLLSGLELVFFFISGLVTTILTIPFWDLPGQITQNTNQSYLLIILFPISLLLVHPGILTKLWRITTRQSPPKILKWRHTLSWLTIHLITWLLGGLILYFAINLIYPLKLSINNLAMLTGSWALAGAISLAGALTFSIIGLREISLTLLLTAIIPTPIALIVAIIMRLIWLIGELISGIISMRL